MVATSGAALGVGDAALGLRDEVIGKSDTQSRISGGSEASTGMPERRFDDIGDGRGGRCWSEDGRADFFDEVISQPGHTNIDLGQKMSVVVGYR